MRHRENMYERYLMTRHRFKVQNNRDQCLFQQTLIVYNIYIL